MIRKEKTPELSQEKANKILQKAFEANHLEANKIPLEVLEAYKNYRKERFILQRIILAALLIAFMLMPILFVTPKLGFSQKEDIAPGRPAYELHIDTSLPVLRVQAVVDGVNMPVYEIGENVYSVRPTQNGLMDVSVTLFNDQSAMVQTVVNGVDTKPPVMLSNGVEDGQLVFYLEDTGLGIDFTTVYAMTEGGDRLYPVAASETTGRVAFDYPTESINVFCSDKVGNTLQLVVVAGNNE